MKTIKNAFLPFYWCIALLLFSFSSAGQIIWEPTNGPYGESVISITERSDGTIIIGTQYNGIYKSSNNGNSWALINQGFACFIPRAYAMLVDTNDIIYAGISAKGLYKSIPGYDYWHIVNDSSVLSQITSMSKTSNGMLFLICYTGSQYVLYKSADMGITIDSVNVPVSNGSKVYIDQNNILFLISPGGVYRSYDEGNAWEIITASNMYQISDFKAVTQQLYICSSSSNGIFASNNAGVSWNQVNNGLTSLYVSTIEYDSIGNIYAGTRKKGVYKTVPPYSSWQQTSNGLFHCNINELKVSVTNKLLAVPYSGGVYYMDNLCNDWHQYPILNTIITHLTTDSQTGTLFTIAHEQGIYRKKLSDSLWLPVNGNFVPNYIYCVSANNNGTVFKGTSGGVYKSTDDGDTWTFSGLYYYSIRSLQITENDIIYAAVEDWVQDHFLFKSTDNGNTWTLIKSLGFMNFKSMAANSHGVVIVMLDNYNYIVSNNEGATWTNYNYGFPYYSPIVTTDNSTNFIAIAEDKLFYSENNGASWVLLYDYNNYNSNITSVLSDEYNGIYIGTSAEHVYYTPDTFNTLQHLPSYVYPYVTCFHHRAGSYIYAGTYKGVFVSDISTKIHFPSNNNLFTNAHPCPFSEYSDINFYIDKSGFAKIIAYDIMGKEVQVITVDAFNKGNHIVRWHPDNLASGIYFLKIETTSAVSTIKLVYEREK